jgi:hypothetical protein
MNNASEKIIERIRQLLAMAADVSSPHEASIAAGRARKLMDQHQIALEDIKDESTGFGYVKVDKAYRFMPKWKDILCVAIAKLNDCKSIKAHEYKVQGSKSYAYRLMFQGFETDVALAAHMYNYLIGTIERLCAAHMRSLNLGASLTKVSDAYKKGAAVEMCARLRAILAARTAEVKTSTGSSLVVFKMAQVEAEFGAAKYTNTKLVTRKDALTLQAQAKGREDAKKIGLDTQIGDPDRDPAAQVA